MEEGPEVSVSAEILYGVKPNRGWTLVGSFDPEDFEAWLEEFKNERCLGGAKHHDQGKLALTSYYPCKYSRKSKCPYSVLVRRPKTSSKILVYERWQHNDHYFVLSNHYLPPPVKNAVHVALATGGNSKDVVKILQDQNYGDIPSRKQISNLLSATKKRINEGKVHGNILPEVFGQNPEPRPQFIFGHQLIFQPRIEFHQEQRANSPPFPENITILSEVEEEQVTEEDYLICELEKIRANTEKVNWETEKLKIQVKEELRVKIDILKLQKAKLEIELSELQANNEGFHENEIRIYENTSESERS